MEHSLEENRVCLDPQGVRYLCADDHEVWMERGAAHSIGYEDRHYAEEGVQLFRSPAEVFQADIVLKVEPPTLKEIDYMKEGSTLISSLQTGSQHKAYFQALAKRKITAIAFEMLEDEQGDIPVVRVMSEIAGSSVILIAAEYLSNLHGGRGIIVGGITGIPPTRVVIIGSGTVAEYAARTALGLGAEVKIFDKEASRLNRVRHMLHRQVFTSFMNYDVLLPNLEAADVLIGAAKITQTHSEYMVTEEMVMKMKKDALIIDVSIDQGGCVETSSLTTHSQPTFRKHGVIHYCVPNITSRVAHTATAALSSILTPLLLEISKVGGIERMIRAKPNFVHGVYTHCGHLTDIALAKRFNIGEYKDMKLLV